MADNINTLPSVEEMQARAEGREYVPPPSINRDKLLALFLPADKAREILGEESYAKIQGVTSREANPQLAWQRMANMALLKEASGLGDADVVKGYDSLKAQYAKQAFNHSGPIDDSTFFSKASELFSRNESRADILAKSVPAMIEQMENNAPFAYFSRNFESQNREAMAFDTVGRDATYQAQRENWDKLMQRRQELAPAIEAAASYLRNFDAFGTDGLQERPEIADLSRLPLEDQQLAIAFASQRVKKEKPEGGFIKKVADIAQVGTGFGIVRSIGRGYVRTEQAASEALTDMLDSERRNKNIRTVQLLTSAYYGEVDPIADPSWSEKSWFSPKYWYASVNTAAESVFESAITSNPLGMTVAALSGRSQMKREMMDSYGVDEFDATLAADGLSIPYMYLNMAERFIAFGKLDKLVPMRALKSQMVRKAARYFNPIAMAQAPIGKQALVAGFRVASGATAEMITETTQNLLPTIGADVIQQLRQDMPEVGWDKYQEIVGDSVHQVFGPALIFAMVGAGVANFRERKIERVLGRTKLELLASGFQDEDIDQLMQAESVDEYEQMIRAYYPRVEAREAQREAMKAINEQTQAKIEGKGVGFEVSGENLFVAQPQSAPEIIQQKHRQIYENPEVQAQLENGVAIEIRKEDGTVVPGVAKGYDEGFTVDTPLQIMEWNGEKMVSTELKEGEDIVTPVSGPEQWKDNPTKAPEALQIERNQSEQYVVKTLQGETIATTNTPEMAAQAINDYATGIIKTPTLTPEQKEAQRQSMTSSDIEVSPAKSVYRAHPESDSAPYDENVVGFTQDEINRVRNTEGMKALDKEGQMTFEALLEHVRANNLHKTAREVAADVLVSGRTINGVEHASLFLRHTELMNEKDIVMQQAFDAYSQFANLEGDRQMERARAIEEEMNLIEQADYVGGSRAGYALGIRRLKLNRETYTVERVKNALGVAKKGQLTAKEEKIIDEAIKNIQLVDAKIKKLEAEVERTALEAMRADAATAISERRKDRRGTDVAMRAQRRQDALGRLKALGYRLNAVSNTIGMAYEASIAIADLADTFIEEGVDKLDDLVAKVKEVVPDLSESDIFYSVGRMAKKQKARLLTELQSRKKELHAQSKLIAEIDMLMRGQKLPESITAASSELVTKLKKKVNELRKSAGKSTRDQKTLERIEAAFSEATDMLEQGWRALPEAGLEQSKAIAEAIAKLNDVHAAMGDMDTIYELEEELRSGLKISKGKKRELSERRKALRERISELRKQVLQKLKEEQRPAREEEAARRNEVREIQKQERKSAREAELEATATERSAESVLGSFAKAHSDTLSWAKPKRDAVRDAVNEQLSNPISQEEFTSKLVDLGVSKSLAARLSKQVNVEAANRTAIQEAKAQQAKEDKALQMEQLLSDLEAQLEGGFRAWEREESFDPEKVASDVEMKIREAKRLMRTQDSNFDIQDQIRRLKRGENAAKVDAPEVENVVMREDLRKALIEQMQLKRKLNNLIEAKRKRSAAEWAYQIFNENRALKATADISVLGRQGLIGALSVMRRNPVAGTKEVATAFIDSIISFAKQDTADGMMVDLKRDPLYLDAVSDGVFFSELDAVPIEREEQFMGLFVERVPGFGALVRGSNRFSVSYMNAIRMAMYRGYRENMPEANRAQRKLFSGWVNRTSGRGNLGSAEGAAGMLNVAFFSARFSVSRVQVMLAPLTYSPMSKDYDPKIYKEVMKDWISYVAFGFATIGLMNLMGAEIEDDPRSPDFMKGKFGSTRLEYWAGVLPPIRLTARAIRGTYKNLGGALGLTERERVALHASVRDFVGFKVSPGLSSTIMLLTGEDIWGREVTKLQIVENLLAPVTFSDIYDVIQEEEGIGKIGAVGITSAVGGSSQTY